MQWLEQAGLADQTVVVVVGDHGEAFGRHQQVAHAGGSEDWWMSLRR
jgi:arylsulfatase A-like enzyme